MQLGTLSGNPVAAVAGLKTMEVLRRDGTYDRLRAIGRQLQDLQSSALTRAGIAHQVCGDETLFDIYFTAEKCTNYRNARHDDPRSNVIYNASLRKNGVFKSPGKLYPSVAIAQGDLELTALAIEEAVREVQMSAHHA